VSRSIGSNNHLPDRHFEFWLSQSSVSILVIPGRSFLKSYLPVFYNNTKCGGILMFKQVAISNIGQRISAGTGKIRMPGLVIGLALSLVLAGCQTTNPYTGEQQTSKTTFGAGIGALGGAAIGAIAGGRKGALIGAGIGALTGGAVGNYMDRQEAALRQRLQNTGVSVTRQGDRLILNMPGNVTFNTNSSAITGNFYPVLDSVALVLNEFNQTYIDVVGYTDSTGAAAYNQTLSEQRAQSVAQYLNSREVLRDRFVVRGAGQSSPIASNETPEGRTQNRRVEIELVPIT
jgi:outer membrane protein OmpA-like peptidoglycan-associated protein